MYVNPIESHTTAAAAVAVSHLMPLRLMFVVGGLYREASGVARILCDLANALVRQQSPVTVYAAACKTTVAEHLLEPPATCRWERGRWLGGLSHSPRIRRVIEQDMLSYDVVHSHSFWMLPNHYASVSAHRHRRPFVFTAHGALEPWALARSRWKKRIIGHWWQDRDFRRAACFHVNSRREMEGIRSYSLKNPVAVVPNGVNVASYQDMPPRDTLAQKHPELAGKRVLLFLSRLHEKKGIAHLVEAWGSLAADHADWHLLLVGPDDGAAGPARQRIASLGLDGRVTFTGTLAGREKIAAYASADAFVLPSFSEGFSMAILEAMAAGLPVVMTPGCNFPEAIQRGAAIEVEPTASSTADGLRTILSMTDEQRRAMGRIGREMIEHSYTWDAIAREMLKLYAWLAGGGDPPGFVEFA